MPEAWFYSASGRDCMSLKVLPDSNIQKSLHKEENFAIFPSRSFFCYLAREIFLPREGNHFCYFCVFDYINEIVVEILLHPFAFQEGCAI